MTPGQLVRRILGPRLFPIVGDFYRSLFVNLEKVVDNFPAIPAGGHILEVGGGHGQLLNHVLARFPTVTATMVDISPTVGDELKPEYRSRVELLPGTSIAEYAARKPRRADLIILCDVIHHVPQPQRPQFLRELGALMQPGTPLAVKDIRRGGWKGWVTEALDRHVSGDKHVHFLVESELEALVSQHIPGVGVQATALSVVNPPNYCLVFSR